MTKTANRNATNPEAVAQAVRAHLRATNRDEADIALEAALLQQGVMTPDEVIEQIEQDALGAIIFFERGDICLLDTDGDVIFVDVDGNIHAVSRD